MRLTSPCLAALAAFWLTASLAARARAEPLHTRFHLLVTTLQAPAALELVPTVPAVSADERAPVRLRARTRATTPSFEQQRALRAADVITAMGVGATCVGLGAFAFVSGDGDVRLAVTLGTLATSIGLLLTGVGIANKRRLPLATREWGAKQGGAPGAGVLTFVVLGALMYTPLALNAALAATNET